MIIRILGSVVILVSILVLPYWVYIPALLAGTILFAFFWEGVLLGFLIDALYKSTIEPTLIFSPFALAIMVIVIILLPVRENLRSYV